MMVKGIFDFLKILGWRRIIIIILVLYSAVLTYLIFKHYTDSDIRQIEIDKEQAVTKYRIQQSQSKSKAMLDSINYYKNLVKISDSILKISYDENDKTNNVIINLGIDESILLLSKNLEEAETGKN